MKPVAIELVSDQVCAIKWDDKSESILFADKTRKECPCAKCKDEKEAKPANPFKILKTNPNNVIFTGWEIIGNYAVKFQFSDKHGTGIYTFDYLKKLGS